jgi:hypothetical protein
MLRESHFKNAMLLKQEMKKKRTESPLPPAPGSAFGRWLEHEGHSQRAGLQILGLSRVEAERTLRKAFNAGWRMKPNAEVSDRSERFAAPSGSHSESP